MAVARHKREIGMFGDVLLGLVSYLAVLAWHVHLPLPAWSDGLLPIVVGIWWLVSAAVRRDVSYRLGGVGVEVRDTVALNAVAGSLVALIALLGWHLVASRLVLAVFPLVSAVVGILGRIGLREIVAHRRRHGRDLRQVLVVGPAGASRRLLDSGLHPDTGLRAVGLLVPPGETVAAMAEAAATAEEPAVGGRSRRTATRVRRRTPQEAAAGAPLLYTSQGRRVLVRELPETPVLGTYDDLADVLHGRAVDQLAVTAPLDDPGLRPIVDLATAEGKTVWLVLDAFGSRLMGREGSGHIVVLTPEHDSYGLVAKRMLDIAVSAIALAVATPIMLGCALAIRMEDPSAPVIFRQRRVGLHGREFSCYKFRSMVADAERQRRDLLHRNEMDGPVFKIKNDPRITRVGRVLRKYSLDEIPQLWNVLRGDMSLVGPRPPLPDEVRSYRPEFRRRLAFRPGLTCLWQVSGRNRVDFKRWMQLDLEYVDNWSVWLDLKILLRTIPVVFFGSGM